MIAIATDVERLIITLEASTKAYERQLAKATGTTVTAMRRIEGTMQASAVRQQAIFARMGAGIQASLRRAFIGGFATLGAAVSGRALVGFADSFNRMENSLKIAGLEGKALTATLQELSQAALKNGAPLEALVGLYSTAAIAQQELNASSAEMIQFTGAVAAALRVTGKSAAESRGAIIQLGQALSGVVRAEEFNAIREGALPILQAVARGLTEAGGSVAKLRQLVVDVKVSSEAFFRAFLVGSVQLEQQARQADFTIGQSMENIRTAFTLAVGNFDEATGASARFSARLNATAEEIGSSRVLGAIRDLAELINSIGEAYDSASTAAREFLASIGLSGPTLAEFLKQQSGLTFSNQAGKGDRLPGPAEAPKTVSTEDFPVEQTGDQKEKLNAFEQANRALERRIALLGVEARVFGQSAAAAETARAKFELLDAAREAGLTTAERLIDVEPKLREQIEQLATAYGNAAGRLAELEEAQKAAAKSAEDLARAQEESIQRMEEMRDAATDSMKGFIKDLIEGKSAVDALHSAMGRLADRLIDMGLDSIFGSIFGGGPGSQLGNFGLFGSFKPNTAGAGGSPASPAYVWVVNGGVAGAAGGGLLSGLGSLFGFGGTAALQSSTSTAALAAGSNSPIPVEVTELPRLETSSFFSGGLPATSSALQLASAVPSRFSGGTTFGFGDAASNIASLGTSLGGGYNGLPGGLSGVDYGGQAAKSDLLNIQQSAGQIMVGAETMADSVGTAADTLSTSLPKAAQDITMGSGQLASGVGQAGQAAQSAAGQFSGAFPGAMQQILQSLSSFGGGGIFGANGASFFGAFGGFGGAPGFTPGVVMSRQHGGPVSAGSPYIVGETGQELFVPRTSGHIIPDIEGFMRAMKRSDYSRGGGGRPITQTNNFIVPSIADRRSQNQVARRSVDELTRSQRTT